MSQTFVVSFGSEHPAKIVKVKQCTWLQFATLLTAEPPEVADKAERGWYIPAEFNPVYRDSENFVSRSAITFDFDHVELATWNVVTEAWAGLAFAMYTTYSNTEKTPRFRVVIPLNRPAMYDEFQAVTRKVAADIGIELIARESFVPAQMMYMPTRKPLGLYRTHVNEGDYLDVDAVLAEYADWTDVKSWPKRAEADGVHAVAGDLVAPDQKSGIVGDFCRLYRIPDAIREFELPYTPTSTEGRWTYTNGSRPEGAIEYDDGLKFHSHHDTDPARGQNNAFDLVRLHKFGGLDTGIDGGTAIQARPSYVAMVSFASGLPAIREAAASIEFEDLGEEVTEAIHVDADGNVVERFAVRDADEFSSGPPVDWIVRGVLPRAELAVIYGESGSGKSFLALDLCAAVTRGIQWRDKRTCRGSVVYVCAEGAGGFKARLRAYARGNEIELRELPAVIADTPNMLEAKDAAAVTAAILNWGKPDVIVIDTLSATTPGGNENSGEDMGRVLSHCKLLHRKTGALVVLIHHSGKDATKGARGWSGLRAAADAEIEVTRNGDFRAARVSKMKDGGDGETWNFKLKQLVLGIDQYGDEESSCIVEHTEDGAPDGGGRQRPSGAIQQLVYDTLKVMAPSGTCNLDDLFKGATAKMPKPAEGRDTRSQHVRRGMEGLISKGLLHMHGEDRIGLTALKQVTDEEWLDG